METGQPTEVRFDQVCAWEAVVENACVPLRVTDAAIVGFSGSLATLSLESLQLTTVRSVRHTCEHDRRHISHAGDDCFLLSLQLSGRGVLDQDGKAAKIYASDMVLYDSTRPFRWMFPDDFAQLVVRVPRESLRYRVSAPSSYTAVRIPADRGLARLTAQHLLAAFQESSCMATSAAPYVASSTVELVAGMLSELARAEPGPRTNLQALHLNKAYAYISENVRRPGLSPEQIAAALNISVRYLHQLFTATDMTVGRLIAQLRLDGCARTLSDPQTAGLSISMIASSWGFDNAAHFSRAFRQRFGISARDYRAISIASALSPEPLSPISAAEVALAP